MVSNNNLHAKHPPSCTWRKTQKPGGNSCWIYVCARFLVPGKFKTTKPGAGANKHKGLRRVFFSYVLTDGAWSYPHATDPSLKGAFHAA